MEKTPKFVLLRSTPRTRRWRVAVTAASDPHIDTAAAATHFAATFIASALGERRRPAQLVQCAVEQRDARAGEKLHAAAERNARDGQPCACSGVQHSREVVRREALVVAKHGNKQVWVRSKCTRQARGGGLARTHVVAHQRARVANGAEQDGDGQWT